MFVIKYGDVEYVLNYYTKNQEGHSCGSITSTPSVKKAFKFPTWQKAFEVVEMAMFYEPGSPFKILDFKEELKRVMGEHNERKSEEVKK